MIRQLILYFIGSFSISLLLTPIVIRLSNRFRVVDDPRGIHPGNIMHTSIPRAGGVAMYIAFSIMGMSVFGDEPIVRALILGGGIIVIAGILDDKFDLSPYLRLLAIWPLAALIAIGAGLSFYMTNPFGEGLLYFDWIQIPTPFDVLPFLIIPAHIVIIVWVLWVINMVKLSKGASQLPGIAFFACLTIAAVALKYSNGNPTQMLTASLAVMLAGAVLAFLPFNFPPERMLPGDSAAAFIGFIIAILSIMSGSKLAAALIVLSVPAIDMFVVIMLRLRRGKNPLTAAGQDHLYHKLMRLGVRKEVVILFYWTVTAVLGVLALLPSGSTGKFFVILSILVVIIGIIVLVHRKTNLIEEDTSED